MHTKELRITHFEKLCQSFSQYELDWQPAIVTSSINSTHYTMPHGIISFIEDNVIDYAPEKSLILVFASAKNPGGGVLNGAVAQEEDIALHTSWYYHIRDAKGFYLQKGDSAINTNKMLYVNNGHILRDKYHNEIEPIPVSFLGATAPNLNGMKAQGLSIKGIYDTMGQRIENVLKFAEKNHHKHLILGAWGCGVFGLDSAIVAQLFRDKIESGLFSGKISFCIKDKKTLEIFKNIFSKLL